MLLGKKIVENKGFTNLTKVHNFISEIALDSGYIDDLMRAYGFENIELRTDRINIGYAIIPLEGSIEIYGNTYRIEKIRDLLLLSHVADIYDVPQNIFRRRIFHANIQPLYRGFLAGFGQTFSLFNFGDKTKEAYIMTIAYTNHYYQDAFAPMHISMNDQDIHIQFEHDFDEFLQKNADMIKAEVLDMLYRRAIFDISKYRNVQALASKMPAQFMSIRDELVKAYREGDRNFEGIEYFVYGAVLSTIGHTADMISKDFIWRRLR